MEGKAIGLVETHRVVAGVLAGDAMLKRAAVELIDARYVCIGKFIVLIQGEGNSVNRAVEAGAEAAGEYLADRLFIRDVHPAVLAAIDRIAPAGRGESLGLIETTTVAACIAAADAAVKAADVALLELRLANRLGGKSYALIWGTVGEVEAAVVAGVATVPEGVLVQQAVIPSLHPDLRNEITKGLAAE
jgi:microcompartment protein CcmL/EutN